MCFRLLEDCSGLLIRVSCIRDPSLSVMLLEGLLMEEELLIIRLQKFLWLR